MKAEVCADAKQQGSEHGRTHYHVDDGQSPSARFPVDSPNVEVKTHDAIAERKHRDGWQNRSRRTSTEKARHSRRGQRRAQDHRRVHDAAAVAALVMLVCDLNTAQRARCTGDKRQPALKTAFPYVKVGLCPVGLEFGAAARALAVYSSEPIDIISRGLALMRLLRVNGEELLPPDTLNLRVPGRVIAGFELMRHDSPPVKTYSAKASQVRRREPLLRHAG